jgi:hypothetical protein
MPFKGTLDDVAATARREIDRARIHSYEVLTVFVGPYVANVLLNPDAIIGEVVSNVSLPSDYELSPTQEERLQSLGWTRPDQGSQPFFHRTWSAEVPSGSIVRDLLTAFICVAQLEEGEQVVCSIGPWCGAPGSGYECDGCLRETHIPGRGGPATGTPDS